MIKRITSDYPSSKKLTGPNNFPGEFHQIYKEDILPVLHKLSENKEKGSFS